MLEVAWAVTIETTFEVFLPTDGAGPERVETLLRRNPCRASAGINDDLRPLVHDLPGAGGGWQLVTLRLALREGATGRPDEVLDALGLDPLDLHLHRTSIVLDDDTP